MRSLSIKKKMMLWYAFVLLVVVGLAAISLLITGDKLVRDGAKANLRATTDRALKDVRIVKGKLNIADDIEYFSNGSYIVIYREDGTPLSGLEMNEFKKKVSFDADKVREVDQDSNSFYVYDRLIENKKVGKIWIRGMASADLDVISPPISRLIMIFLLALPVILIMALLGGWLITKKAFEPLAEINETAQRIYEGNDLSLRIGLAGTAADGNEISSNVGDEILQTAATFDHMLDGIEKNFESEKRFTNDASHELRTPTAVIMSQSEYALQHTDDPAETREALETILGKSKKMSSLLDKLLMLARADRGVIQLGSDHIDLGLLIESSAAHLMQAAEEKNISVSIEVSDDVYMTGDMALMERALENVIGNAIKYGRQHGNVLVKCLTEETPSAKIAVVTVKDDGIGMSREHLEHIWDRFYRIEGAGDHEGMGLGLSLTKWIVTEHKGTITAESAEGEGSIFTIRIPVSFPGADPENNVV